jgi:nicotinamide-nucleotide amidase
MKVEVIAIGNEVLGGNTLNTNAAFLSRELIRLGFSIQRHTALPDAFAALREGLQEALERSSVVIATGGLGPTLDDITRQVAAELFASDFVFDAHWASELHERYRGQLTTVKDQATVPEKAQLIPNGAGTAPGFIFKDAHKTLILLPGVPLEMQEMWEKHVKTYLQKQFPTLAERPRRVVYLFNMPEAQVDPELRSLQTLFPTVQLGIYSSLGLLTLHVEGDSQNDVDAVYQVLCEKYATHHYDAPSGKIEEAVQARFIEQGWTLCTAESCTGGRLAARLTRMPGASRYFKGSVVAYANEAKSGLLNVSAELLKVHGAVSAPVVEAMAQGALALFQTDYALAVTGIAGPEGGTPEKPVGTVWICCAKKGGEIRSRMLPLRGNREMIMERAVNALLAELLL